jgi:hypothetical protein
MASRRVFLDPAGPTPQEGPLSWPEQARNRTQLP